MGIKDLAFSADATATVSVAYTTFSDMRKVIEKLLKAEDEISALWAGLQGPTPTPAEKTNQNRPASPPESPPEAPMARAYVSPPPPPPPVPAAVLERLSDKFTVHQLHKPAPAPEPKPAAPVEDHADKPRYAHFRDADQRFPADVCTLLRAGDAPWKAWRLFRDMTQTDLVRAGVTSSGSMSELEGKRWRQNRMPSPVIMERLSKALDVPVVDLTPYAVLDHPMLDRRELDRREREFEAAERAIKHSGGHSRPGQLLRKGQREILRLTRKQPRVDIVGLHARESQECKKAARDLPLSFRFLTFDEFRRSTPSAHVVVFQKGVPHAAFNVGQLKAQGVSLRYANGGVGSVLEILRAINATEQQQTAAA